MKLVLQSEVDPIIDGTVVQKDSYFNVDMVRHNYNYLDTCSLEPLKNAIEAKKGYYRYRKR
jgi:hypothetical protein